jgi:CRP-like cAMP-binding protein
MQSKLVTRAYPPRGVLFRQGRAADGVFYVQDGIVDLVATGKDHVSQQVDSALEGSVLGLTEVFAGARHRVSAICRSFTLVTFVERDDLLNPA